MKILFVARVRCYWTNEIKYIKLLGTKPMFLSPNYHEIAVAVSNYDLLREPLRPTLSDIAFLDLLEVFPEKAFISIIYF